MTSPSLPWIGQSVMSAMQTLGKASTPVSLPELIAATQLSRLQVNNAAARLVTSGLLKRTAKIQGMRHARWKLTLAGDTCIPDQLRSGPKQAHTRQRQPLRVPTLREQFWHLLRCKQKLSIPEALEVLLNPGDDVERASNNLQRYIRGLAKGGYISLLSARIPGNDLRSNGHRRWFLTEDTGRLPPTLLAKGGIYDHNTRSMRP
ncbi:hypothetical protein BH11PSE12_BH11PSE12_18420 [soil metagenome]